MNAGLHPSNFVLLGRGDKKGGNSLANCEMTRSMRTVSKILGV